MAITKRFASEEYVTEQITAVDEKVIALEETTSQISETIDELKDTTDSLEEMIPTDEHINSLIDTALGKEVTEIASLVGGDA